jgi:spore germination protein YaaH
MQGAVNWTEEQGVGLNWDESAGQYIAEKENSDGTTNIIWMEEPRSLELKIRAVKESGAAGAAGWRLGTETKEVWPLLQELTK